jgi:uncharacterized protein YndB with AHSA1/START domain
MPDGVRLISRILIHGRIEDVWREITKTDEPQLAIFGARMHRGSLGPGSPIRMRTRNGKYTSVVGEILEVDPPHRFSHTMKFTAYDDPYCKVTYVLEEVPHGVQFTLISEDVPPGTRTEKGMRRGGDFIAATLKAIVEQGRPPLGTRLLYGVMALLVPMTPSRCKTEHWPLEATTDG